MHMSANVTRTASVHILKNHAVSLSLHCGTPVMMEAQKAHARTASDGVSSKRVGSSHRTRLDLSDGAPGVTANGTSVWQRAREKVCLSAKLGLVMMVLTTLMVFIGYSRSQPLPVDYPVYGNNNNTCPAVFDLSDNVKLSLCLHSRDMVVDIRRYENGRPTIKGVSLSATEYFVLGQQYNDIYAQLQRALVSWS